MKINKILDILKTAKVPEATLQLVVQEFKKQEDLKNDNKDASVKNKKQFVLLSTNKDTGFALQIEESVDTATTVDLIKKATKAYNATKKGVKFPVKTVSEALNTIPSRFLVEVGVWAKTKEQVRLLSVAETL